MNIDLELYRIFYTVAKCKNISKATEKLYISQPAITQRINNLEKQLDIKLFHRRPDGMKLTTEGKELYNYIKNSIETMNNVENKFNGYLKKNINNHIRIKITDQIDNLIFYNILISYLKKYPQIGVDLDVESEKETINDLLEGQADIIIIRNIEKNKRLQIVATKKLTPCLYTSTKYIDEHNGKIDLLNKSEHYNFILPKQDSIERKEFDKLCKKNHITIKNKFEIQDINIRKYFVLNGLGIALGFKEYIQEELKKNMFIEIPLQDALPKGNLNWVVLNNESKKDEILKLIEMIKDEERSCN